jgi:Protein of unknown function (DUF3558)
MTEPRRPAIAAALGIAGCLLLAACGQGAPSAADNTAQVPATTSASSVPPAHPASSAATDASAGTAQACSLVTERDAGTALGKDPGPGSKFTTRGSSQCQYGNYATGLVLVNFTPTRGRAGYDLMHTNLKVGHVADTEGLGDRGFTTSGPNTASIYFDKGDALVVVMVSIHNATTPPTGQALALAKSAADRI